MNTKTKKISRNSGQAVMIATIFFLVVSMIFIVGIITPMLNEAQITNDLILSGQSYYTAEAETEDSVYRLKNDLTMPANDTLTLGGSTASVKVATITGGKQIDATGENANLYRVVEADVSNGLGASLDYATQSGAGGVNVAGGAQVNGSVYSNGPLVGALNVTGDLTSAGPSGVIRGTYFTSFNVGGNAYAHTITNATIDGGAYYGCATTPTTCFSNDVVFGTLNPNSPDPALVSMPIPDSSIQQWESQAASGTVINCSGTYTLTASTAGPEEIGCSVSIGGGNTISLGGPLWVKGNLTLGGGMTLDVPSSDGSESVPIVVDDPSNESGGSVANIAGGSTFNGSGAGGSYILVVSMNTAAQNGNRTDAITMTNGSGGNVILYAPHGQVTVTGGSNAEDATGYTVNLSGGASINYQDTISNLSFPSEPSMASTTYSLSKWQEVQ